MKLQIVHSSPMYHQWKLYHPSSRHSTHNGIHCGIFHSRRMLCQCPILLRVGSAGSGSSDVDKTSVVMSQKYGSKQVLSAHYPAGTGTLIWANDGAEVAISINAGTLNVEDDPSVAAIIGNTFSISQGDLVWSTGNLWKRKNNPVRVCPSAIVWSSFLYNMTDQCRK